VRVRALYLLVIGLAVILALGILPQDAAAQGSMTKTATKTIRVDPENEQATVTVDLELRNDVSPTRNADGSTTHWWFDSVRLAIPPSATELKATSQSGLRLDTSRWQDGDFAYAEIELSSKLEYQRTQKLTVTYTIPNSGPRADYVDSQISSSFVSLTIWADGSPGRSRVRVIFPSSFRVDAIDGLEMVRTQRSGQTILEASAIANPGGFVGKVLGRRDTEPLRTSLTLANGTAQILAEPSDVVWHDFVRNLLRDDLPVLEDLIGASWPIDHVIIKESSEPRVHGWGGWFNLSRGTIEIDEDLDRDTLLHELSHAWFNSEHVDGRWLREGLAEEFASRVIEASGDPRPNPNVPDLTDSVRVPLLEWQTIGQVRTEQDRRVQRYHYNASWWVFRQVSDAVGIETLGQVIRDLDSQTSAFEDKRVAVDAGSRELFDLIDLQTDMSDEALDALFATYVFPVDAVDLQVRRAATSRYEQLVDAVGEHTPLGLNQALADWRFGEATAMLDAAEPLVPLLQRFDSRRAEVELLSESATDLFGAAKTPLDLGLLERDLVAAAAEIETVTSARSVADEAAVDQGVEIDWPSLRLDELELAEVDATNMQTRVEQFADARAHLAATAAQAGVVVEFRNRMDLVEAETDVRFKTELVETLLSRRVRLANWAKSLGLTMPQASIQSDLSGADQMLDDQEVALQAFERAAQARDGQGLFTHIGLVGTDLKADLAASRQAFAAGSFSESTQAAYAVKASVVTAADRGRIRSISAGILVLMMASVVLFGVAYRRKYGVESRSRSASPVAPNHAGEVLSPFPHEPVRGPFENLE